MFRTSFLVFTFVLGSLDTIFATAQTAPINSLNAIQKTTLTLSVLGVHNDKGQVLNWVQNGPDGFPTKDNKAHKFFAVDANKAVSGTVTTIFDLTPGTCVVATLYNNNKTAR